MTLIEDLRRPGFTVDEALDLMEEAADDLQRLREAIEHAIVYTKTYAHSHKDSLDPPGLRGSSYLIRMDLSKALEEPRKENRPRR